MALLILTQENIETVKRYLRERLTTISSSHLTEAIAAGLGFHTNAALRAVVEADRDGLPHVAYASESHFRNRLALFGYADLDDSLLEDSIRQHLIYDRPYTEFRRGELGPANACFSICRENNRPMITIAMARRYAELQWDCITLHPNQEGHLQGDRGHELVSAMFARFQESARGHPGAPVFDGSAFVGRVERLLPDVARNLADDYFRMLYEPVYSDIGAMRAAYQ